MFNKAISMVLASFILMQGMNVHFKDALNIKTLMEHIELHKSEYGDDLFTFIAKHYGSKISEHEEHDGDDHQKLPFHQGVCSDSAQLVMIKPLATKWISMMSEETKKVSFHYNNFYSYQQNSEIFQPPRQA